MGKLFEEITPELQEWITQQHMFFVATAPDAEAGHINCSPKGMDSFRILGPNRVGFLDLTGSGAETIAHIRDNGRITIMFCAFSGPPKILRLYGRGQFYTPDSAQWPNLESNFPSYTAARSIITVDVSRIADSCGYGVPKFQFEESRETLVTWGQKKGVKGVHTYQQERNKQSIDGLPALGDQPEL